MHLVLLTKALKIETFRTEHNDLKESFPQPIKTRIRRKQCLRRNYQVNIDLFNVNSKNSKCGLWSKLTIKTPERCH